LGFVLAALKTFYGFNIEKCFVLIAAENPVSQRQDVESFPAEVRASPSSTSSRNSMHDFLGT
jgi:hypothetical protein